MGKSKPYFNEEHFRSLAQAIFQNAINATGNAGQIAILEQMYENCIDTFVKISSIGRKPSRSVWQSAMVLGSSPEKYSAVSEIALEISEGLGFAWDDANGGDAKNIKLYLDLGPDYFQTNVPTTNALTYGMRARMIRGGL